MTRAPNPVQSTIKGSASASPPRPTGYLHVGGARTALFNWLYARRHGGTFVLRIEDTDVERSSADMVTGIVDGLRWLGLDWDEGPDVGGPHAPYFQSERLDRYRAMADRSSPRAAPTTATARPRRFKRSARRPRPLAAAGCTTARAWRSRRRDQRRSTHRARRAPCVSWCPAGETTLRRPACADRSRSPTRTSKTSSSCAPIAIPPTTSSVVVDDVDMAITDVVRGDDHISNTPKQVLLYQAFGRRRRAFAHVPLILGPDKKRLSKRHGATSVMEYRPPRLSPEAMVNFLALLGWSPGGRSARSSRATSSSPRSRSKASAAATPSSIRKSSTGSISSTSCG